MTILIHDKYSSETGWQGYLWYTRKLFCHDNGSNTTRIVLFGIENVLQKKRKPDVVRKDVQWSTKKPHMLKKKNGTQSETNKTGLPWSTNWLNPNCESKVSLYKKSCTSTVKIPCEECLFPKCVVVVCLFVSLFCIFYIYDESLQTKSQPTARIRTKGKKEKEHFIYFFSTRG